MSKRWIAVGTLVLVGAYWASVRALVLSELSSYGVVPYAAHAIGAFATGCLISLFAPVRPTREPVIAVLLGVAVIAIMFLALPHPHFSWVAARSGAPWLFAALIAAGSAAFAIAGAALGRRAQLGSTGPVTIAVLSFFILLGTVVTLGNTMFGIGIEGVAVIGLAAVASMWGAGYFAQSLLTVRRPWSVALGTVGTVLFNTASRNNAAHLE